MGFYTTDTLEAAPPRRAPARRACDGVASQRRRARRDPVCSRKPLRGPTRGAISGYRFYSPRLGRWINRDPIGETESLNLLFFCKNEPNNYIDILGNSFKDWLPVIGVYISLNKSLRWEIEFDYLECVKCTVPKNYPAAHLVGTDEHSCLECMKDLR